jgi:hypothetical protein
MYHPKYRDTNGLMTYTIDTTVIGVKISVRCQACQSLSQRPEHINQDCHQGIYQYDHDDCESHFQRSP